MDGNNFPFITIAIPTYNRAKGYFKEALESALSQTYINFELIISDNCSTDNTEEFVKSYTDNRIRYYKQSVNIAANDNFNFCLDMAKGRYFLLLHDDDLIDNDFLEKCIEVLNKKQDVGIIRTGTRIIDEAGIVVNEKKNFDKNLEIGDFFCSWLEGHTWMLLCGTLFNTKYLKNCGGFNSKYQLFQDVLAEFKLAKFYGRIDIEDIRASFRKHPFQRTENVKVKEWCNDSMYLLGQMCRFVPEEKSKIYSKGLIHFSKHNYGIAENISSFIKRNIWYFRIYKIFNFKFSPVRYFYQKKVRKIFSFLGKYKRIISKVFTM